MSCSREFELLRLNQQEALDFVGCMGASSITNLQGGLTLIKNDGSATIVIDRDLDFGLQTVYLSHEEEQLRVIREMNAKGFPFSASCEAAHQAGLMAGVNMACRLGVLEKYLKHRGVNTIDELE